MNMVQEIEKKVKTSILEALVRAKLVDQKVHISQIVLEKPNNEQHGDYATNIAMQLTKVAKQPPRQIAQAIVDHIDVSGTYIRKVDIAGPGFINIFMDYD
ncbi:hypothetical protein CAI16_16400, partial [Virgibacillus dokdonensis]